MLKKFVFCVKTNLFKQLVHHHKQQNSDPVILIHTHTQNCHWLFFIFMFFQKNINLKQILFESFTKLILICIAGQLCRYKETSLILIRFDPSPSSFKPSMAYSHGTTKLSKFVHFNAFCQNTNIEVFSDLFMYTRTMIFGFVPSWTRKKIDFYKLFKK